jgi:Fe-S-cluster-containing hydrogenase component 2
MSFLQRLKQKVDSEVMACIGCNDCMIACPLPETEHVTIAELNAAVRQNMISRPNVREFVMACTQCHQCEPVCPADISRADMVLWNKMKIQEPDRLVNLQDGKILRSSGLTLRALVEGMQKCKIFTGIGVPELQSLALRSTLRRFVEGEVLFQEGELHERFFLILRGSVKRTVKNKNGQLWGWVLTKGDSHGAWAVLANQVESFTLTSNNHETLVLEIPKAPLQELRERSTLFSRRIEELSNDCALIHWYYTVQSQELSLLPVGEVEKLKKLAGLRVLQAGELLCQENDPTQFLYFVITGLLSRKSKEHVFPYLHEGDTIGGYELVSRKQRQTVTIQATSRAEVIFIAAKDYQDALDRHPQVRKTLGEKFAKETVEKHRQEQTTPNTGSIPRLSWEQLVNRGVMQGREVLAIDQSRCIDCNNCVDACGRRHGHRRLARTGLQLDHLLFPTACRHCKDAPCLICQVNAIERLPSKEIKIHEKNCTGCGDCAERCPYGNIQMYDPKPPAGRAFWSSLLGYLLDTSPEKSKSAAVGEKRLAVKCDLCIGYKDYACVTACPVGAALRIDPVEAFGRPPEFSKGKQ